MTARFTLSYEPRPSDFSARIGRRARGIGARGKRRHSGRRAIILLAAVAVPAFAAPEDWKGFDIGNAGSAEVSVEPMPFEQPGQSFPGSAFYYLSPDDLAASRNAVHTDAGVPLIGLQPVPAARAMRVDNSGVDRSRALQCLTAAIYYEAASEPDAGQRAVAQVVLNRVAHPAYPDTVCGVVYQGSERVTGCQFSFTCDGSLARRPSAFFWRRAEDVARAALSGYVYAPVGLATHYHTIAVHPYWAPSLSFLGTIGAHRFYRFGGSAGQPGAFRFAYRGGEPLPAPHPRTSAPTKGEDPTLDPLIIQRAFEGTAKVAQDETTPVVPVLKGLTPARASAPAPVYSEELQKRGGDALYSGEKLPEATGVRPEYRQSGRWIIQPGS